MLLFAADAEGMCAFPADHPYDHQSRRDLGHQTAGAADGAATAAPTAAAHDPSCNLGAAIEVRTGDALYVPTHWWRQTHERAAPKQKEGAISLVLSFQVRWL